jgi:hypothetical protein
MKLNYVLGLIAVAGGTGLLITIVVASIIGGEGAQYVIPKVIWTPFVIWWGIRRIKAYCHGKSEVNNGR